MWCGVLKQAEQSAPQLSVSCVISAGRVTTHLASNIWTLNVTGVVVGVWWADVYSVSRHPPLVTNRMCWVKAAAVTRAPTPWGTAWSSPACWAGSGPSPSSHRSVWSPCISCHVVNLYILSWGHLVYFVTRSPCIACHRSSFYISMVSHTWLKLYLILLQSPFPKLDEKVTAEV